MTQVRYTQAAKDMNAEMELKMQESGASKFLDRHANLTEKGKGSDTMAGRGLIFKASEALAERLEEYVSTSRTGKAGIGAVLSQKLALIVKVRKDKKLEELPIDYPRIALAASVCLVDAVLTEKEHNREFLTQKIGSALEDEARYTLAQLNRGTWFSYKMSDFEKKDSTYTHMRRSLIWQLNKVDSKEGVITFESWTQEEKKKLGLVILKFLEDIFGDDLVVTQVFNKLRKKSKLYIKASPEMLANISKLNQEVSKTCVEYRPIIIEPRPWKAYERGGYHTIQMPFVKYATDEDASSRDYSIEMEAANAVQATPWAIDKRILQVQKALNFIGADLKSSDGKTIWYSPEEIPEPPKPVAISGDNYDSTNPEHLEILKAYKKEKEKIYDLNLMRCSKFISQIKAVEIANEYKDFERIYFPVQCDFRMRLYSVPGTLQPQGSDNIKSLLRFGSTVKLTDDGMWWLAVNCAGAYGFDKVGLDERAQWAYNKLDEMRVMCADPLDNVDLWKDADKPFMYLQACMELVDAMDAWDRGEDFYTSLPVQVDGKCNGIQHYSMIMRDEEVGKLVGIGENDSEHDVYTYAAERILEVIKNSEVCPEQQAWAEFGIPRKIAKRPVMTSVYSASRFGFVEQIKAEMATSDKRPEGDDFELAQYLGGQMDQNMRAIIGRAADAMDFLKACVHVYVSYYNNDLGACHGLRWTNPLGTGVHQSYQKKNFKQISARLGKTKVKVNVSINEDLADVTKMKNGICPNFVHAIDAAHMYSTIVRTKARVNNISFSMIHDSFGTHASHVDTLVEELKEAAIEIHSRDLLAEFKEGIMAKLPEDWHDKLPELPERGSMNIEDLRSSELFFS